MRVTWEENDIRPGRRTGKPGRVIGGSHDEVWIIGFLSWADRGEYRRYVLIAESDGQVCEAKTKLELADQLNSWGLLPLELCGEVRGVVIR